MSDYVIPEPEPKEIDEKLSFELRHLADNAVLKAMPSGNEKCENCRKCNDVCQAARARNPEFGHARAFALLRFGDPERLILVNSGGQSLFVT